MKIAILTMGTRGDVQPYAVLGQALHQRGHEVTLSAGKNFEALVTSYGIHFHPLESDFQAILDSEEGTSSRFEFCYSFIFNNFMLDSETMINFKSEQIPRILLRTMKTFILTFSWLGVILISGCIEKETTLSVNYLNSTNRHIQLFTYPGDPFSSSSDTSWFSVSSNEEMMVLTKAVGGEYSSLPNNIFPNFTSTDSCVVVISDTLKITHYTRSYSLNLDSVRENVIAYDDNRNIFNQEYFNIDKTGEYIFKATYRFMEDDVEYAISLNE